jgi:hypothetical protein
MPLHPQFVFIFYFFQGCQCDVASHARLKHTHINTFVSCVCVLCVSLLQGDVVVAVNGVPVGSDESFSSLTERFNRFKGFLPYTHLRLIKVGMRGVRTFFLLFLFFLFFFF